ncbi:MAG: hypothetical protein ABIG03_02860 [Candidatus Eisenbacteria bacterium]
MRAVATAVLVCLFAFGLCSADDNPADVMLWSQTPDLEGTAWASQQAVDVPFFAECVNDFESPSIAEINHVHWWGTYWGKKRSDAQLSIQQVDWQGRPTGRALDCTGSQRVTCGADSITGSNVGGVNNVTYYSCAAWNEGGPEVVYQLKVPFPSTYMEVTLEQFTVDLDVFLLSECDENTCLTYGSLGLAWTFTEPGTYYLVVDGYNGAQGPFALWINCPGVPGEFYCVRFYGDTAGPSRAHPATMLYEYWTDDYHEVDEGGGLYSYWADIPPFPVAPGQRYWASFQCVSERYVTGQWGWWTTPSVELEHPYMDFEYLSIPRWTFFPDAPIYNDTDDLAFELFADESPVARTTWGTIKSLYR